MKNIPLSTPLYTLNKNNTQSASTDPIRVMLLDDHKLVRDCYRLLLTAHINCEIVASCSHFSVFMEQLKIQKPQVVLMDINLGTDSESGMSLISDVRKYSPGTKILMVSMHTGLAYSKKAFKYGAHGYISKNSPGDEVIKGVREVLNGNKYVCPEIKNSIFESSLEAETSDVNKLTERELNIINLLYSGSSSKEIAGSLHISPRTVEKHRYNILKKLNIKNTAALVNFASRNQLVGYALA